MTTLILEIGKTYENAAGARVTLTEAVARGSLLYDLGYRFTDSKGRAYTEAGLRGDASDNARCKLVKEFSKSPGPKQQVSSVLEVKKAVTAAPTTLPPLTMEQLYPEVVSALKSSEYGLFGLDIKYSIEQSSGRKVSLADVYEVLIDLLEDEMVTFRYSEMSNIWRRKIYIAVSN